MIEFNQIVPIKYNENKDFDFENLKLYFEKRWRKKIYENLKSGYNEMSKINLDLAEVGLEYDIEDLFLYESILGGVNSFDS